MASASNSDTHESPLKSVYKDPDDGRQRFSLKFEFVQCLANPTYIHYIFEDEAFIGHLKYLQYWQRPEYIKFIMYLHCLFFLEHFQNSTFRNAMVHPTNKLSSVPHCLFFLEVLQNPTFRNAMAHPNNKEVAHRQQFYFWKNYRNNRLKHILPRPLLDPATAPPTSAPPASLPSSVAPPPPAPAPVTAAALSPMQYAIPPGSDLAKTDPMNASVD